MSFWKLTEQLWVRSEAINYVEFGDTRADDGSEIEAATIYFNGLAESPEHTGQFGPASIYLEDNDAVGRLREYLLGNL